MANFAHTGLRSASGKVVVDVEPARKRPRYLSTRACMGNVAACGARSQVVLHLLGLVAARIRSRSHELALADFQRCVSADYAQRLNFDLWSELGVADHVQVGEVTFKSFLHKAANVLVGDDHGPL